MSYPDVLDAPDLRLDDLEPYLDPPAIEFRPWPKIARLNREMIVTEKIDGSNAAVIVTDAPHGYGAGEIIGGGIVINLDEHLPDPDHPEWPAWRPVLVAAQSRNHVISPEKDNFGFARWVRENAEHLARGLGEGYHFGEWYGSGIQRGYGLTGGEKRFMLFNVDRHADGVASGFLPEGVEVSTVLYRGPFSTDAIKASVDVLRWEGSAHVPGFSRPEGVVAFHVKANVSFKVTLEKDEVPKALAEKGLEN